ncbi:hypothetical protein ANO11243_031970 [Dothideomycetidae sp. 11243]|nr:hypothetical protein ANO11243_031970 [fungal sp. No.11243]
MGVVFFSSPELQGPDAHLYIQSEQKLRNTTYGLLILSTVFLLPCWVTVLLRIYTRARLIKAFGQDDWSMSFTMVSCFCHGDERAHSLIRLDLFHDICLVHCQDVLGSARVFQSNCCRSNPRPGFRNSSKNNCMLAQGNCSVLLQMNLELVCWYSATMIGLKISLGAFLYKIFESKPAYRWIIVATSVILTAAAVAGIVVTIEMPCGFEPYFFAGLKECAFDHHTQSMAWSTVFRVWTILNTTSDGLYAVLSVIAIVSMQLEVREKFVAVFLCTMGTLGGVASIIRLCMLCIIVPGYSEFGQTIIELQWSVVEPGLGITAASTATLRPLVREVNKWRAARRKKLGSSNPHMQVLPLWPAADVENGLDDISILETFPENSTPPVATRRNYIQQGKLQ